MMRGIPGAWVATILIGLVALPVASSEPEGERAPKKVASDGADVPNFSLLDYRGRHHELRRADARAVVLYFTSFGCSTARANLSKLRSLRRQYETNGVTFWMVNAATHEDPDDTLIAFMIRSRSRGLVPEPALEDPTALRQELLKSVAGTSVPVLRDELQAVARRFGVENNCEAIVIDTEKMAIVYRGAIEETAEDGTKTKPLVNALNDFVAGKPVATARTEVSGCKLNYKTSVPTNEISYSKEIAPMLQKHCVSCHSPGNIGPFALSNYKKVKGWSAMIEEVVLDRRMPPWHADPHYGKFENHRGLSAAETHTLLQWIKQGAPRGEGEDPLTNAPPPAVTWALGKPDFTVTLPKPEKIPATGTLNYRYIDADFELPQDAWFRAAVCRPGDAKVVHHIIVRVRYPEDYKDRPAEGYLFTTWVPGLSQEEFPSGTGVFLPKGSRFNFEMHYTTMGQATTDQSELGLYLAKEPAKRRLEVRASETRDFELAPGDKNAQHYSHYCFKRDAILYELSPHMHLRGSWFKFELLHPSGKRETLLSVPNYDFNWQTSYRLAEPKRIPAGTWMLCTGGHDNSAKNPNNPDPTKRVRWGLQSWDEMFMGFMTVADAVEGTAGGP